MDARRRRILADMGIDVWFARKGAAAAPALANAAAAASATVVAEAPARDEPPSLKPSRHPQTEHHPPLMNNPAQALAVATARSQVADGAARAAKDSARQPAAVAGAHPPFTLTIVAGDGAALITGAMSSRAQLRFVGDMLAALPRTDTGPPVAAHRVVAFQWPLTPGETGDPQRATAAFVRKQLTQARARFLFVTTAVTAPVDDWVATVARDQAVAVANTAAAAGSFECVVLPCPDLTELLTDPQAKSSLWQTIQKLGS